jgi:tRNA threonylcarbamoyladenosine biosynthesis protein TsaB
MALILLLETATDICSVGLGEDGRIVCREETKEPYAHTSELTLLIGECMKQSRRRLSDLDAVAVSSGPGPYTALRVGASAAKGICFALNKPLIAVDTLAALARASGRAQDAGVFYCPMIDARRMEVYTAVFDEQFNTVAQPHATIVDERAFEEHFSTGRTLIFSGNGAAKCKSVLTARGAVFRDVVCSADHLAIPAEQAFGAGDFADLAYFTPLYLKPPNITAPKKML